MRFARWILLPVFACLISPAVAADKESDSAKWTDLLPGNDLSKHWHTKGNWSIDKKTGVITLTPRKGEKGWARFDAYLWSNVKYDDFAIEFEYKVQKRGNSGFYFNVGDKKSPVKKGIEVQIYDSGSKGKKKRLTDHDSGGVIPGIPPKKNAAKPAGDWNRFLVTVKGDTLTIELNGVVVNTVDLNHKRLKGRPKSGYIGFQDHALPLQLRKIRIRKL